MPARPRKARRPNTETLVRDWIYLVKKAERGAWKAWAGSLYDEGDDSLWARDQLEVQVRRGGARGRRLLRRLEPLDARFRAATTPRPFAPDGSGWWNHHNLD